MAFLRIFCIYIFDLNKWQQGLVSVIKQMGCMLPLRWCARNKNSTLFLCQIWWLLFFTFSETPCKWLINFLNHSNELKHPFFLVMNHGSNFFRNLPVRKWNENESFDIIHYPSDPKKCFIKTVLLDYLRSIFYFFGWVRWPF